MMSRWGDASGEESSKEEGANESSTQSQEEETLDLDESLDEPLKPALAKSRIPTCKFRKMLYQTPEIVPKRGAKTSPSLEIFNAPTDDNYSDCREDSDNPSAEGLMKSFWQYENSKQNLTQNSKQFGPN